MIEINEKLILLDLEAETSTEVIQILCGALEAQRYIGPDYCQAVLDREEEYPTGLPSEGAAAAIPHAFSGSVMRTGTAIGVLKKPVSFRNMAFSDENVEVEVVFLLANASGADAHLDTLQELMDCMSRPSLLLAVKNARSGEEIVEIFQNIEDYPEE